MKPWFLRLLGRRPEPVRSAHELREHLLGFCDHQLHEQTLRGDNFGRKGVRAGMHAARAVIDRLPLTEQPGAYLHDLLAALEVERARLDSPTDDDGYSLGGLATVRTEVERLLKGQA